MATGKAGKQNTGGTVKPAAEQPGSEKAQDQALSAAGENRENGGEVKPAPGEDNNRRLAFLEDRATLLHGVAFSLAGALAFVAPDQQLCPLNETEDPVDASLRIIAELGEQAAAASTGIADIAAKLETFHARDERLLEALAEAELEPEPDESPTDAAIRLIAAQRARIAELSADAGSGPSEGDAAAAARKALKSAVRNEQEFFDDLPDTAAITLQFGDGDRFVVPPTDIGREQLGREGDRVVLNRRIDFAPDLNPARITHAYLIAGKKSLSCEIPGGLRVGGGNVAAIPSGHLAFGGGLVAEDPPATAEPEAETAEA